MTHGKWPKQWPRQSYATVLFLGIPLYSSRLDKLTSGLGHVWIINSKWKSMMQLFIPNFSSSLALWLYLVFSRIDARLIWWQSDIDSGNGLWSLGSKPAQLHSPLPQCRRYLNTLRKYPRWLYWGILVWTIYSRFYDQFFRKKIVFIQISQPFLASVNWRIIQQIVRDTLIDQVWPRAWTVDYRYCSVSCLISHSCHSLKVI